MGSVKFFLNWNGTSADWTIREILVRQEFGDAQISQTGEPDIGGGESSTPLWTVHVQNTAARPGGLLLAVAIGGGTVCPTVDFGEPGAAR